jgi:hypothetical protein
MINGVDVGGAPFFIWSSSLLVIVSWSGFFFLTFTPTRDRSKLPSRFNMLRTFA